MSHCRCGTRWCAFADAILDVPGMHVIDVEHDEGRLVLRVETDQMLAGCPRCGVVAVAHGRRLHRLHDAPALARPVVLAWWKRIWRCPDEACGARTFSEVHDLAPPRAKLTRRAVAWATDALAHDDTSVSALARHLGVDWHTLWGAVAVEAAARTSDPARLDGVRTLGVDEHVWRPGRFGAGRDVTTMVDLTRDGDGRVHARLLDVVQGRSGPVYQGWLREQSQEFRDGVQEAALDPFRGYSNALRDDLADAVQVLDAFHVVKLGTQMVDEVRRRVQQDTLGHRGHRDDPLYKIRGLLRHGQENLTDRAITKIQANLSVGDPTGQIELAWSVYQRLRSIYHQARAADGRRIAQEVLATLASCPVPEIARLGRTLRQWRTQLLAYFDTDGVSNGGTEAINGVIEKTRRLAMGFRNFTNYRLRLLLAADGTRPYRRRRKERRPRTDP